MAPPKLTAMQMQLSYGVSDKDLADYEAEGLLRPLRSENEAYYSLTDKTRIQIILKGQRLGFALSEIRMLLNAHMPSHITSKSNNEISKRQMSDLEKDKDALLAAIERLRIKLGDDF